MTIKVRNAMKNGSLFSLLLLFFVACADDDLNSVDAGFIDNLNFVTDTIVSEITFFSEDVPSVQSTPAGQYLLGVYQEPSFGTLSSSFVSQVKMPSNIYRNETELAAEETLESSTIEDVVLYIPYQASVTSVDNNLYTYQLDSIFGVKNEDVDPTVYGSFDLEVHELETFLNPLDPSDPSKVSEYYTDKFYKVTRSGSEANGSLAALTYTPSSLDTVTSITRLDETIETVSMDRNAPRIAIHLDADFFKTKILDVLPKFGESTPPEFLSQDSFSRYFKGLYVLTDTIAPVPGSMPSLLLSNAYVEMYYSNVISSTLAENDTISVTKRFDFGGVKASKYVNDRAAVKDPAKIYVQGAAGSLANIKLLGYDDMNPTVVSAELAGLREESNKNGNPIWLINEASVQLYVDDDYLATQIDNVYKLFLYKKVQDASLAPLYNSQLLDYISASEISVIEGDLLLDDDDSDDGNKGYYYKFRITDYITELLDGNTTKNVDNLGLKLYNNGDYPGSATDTIVGSASWNPRGVVLYGSDGDALGNRKTVLKINYSVQSDNVE